jgi:hypothetical protein
MVVTRLKETGLRLKPLRKTMRLVLVWLLLSSAAMAHGAEAKLAACSLPIVVRATLLAEDAPQWSTAMIFHVKNEYSKSYTINPGSNQLAPGVTILEIHKLAIVVDNQGVMERCTGKAHEFTGTKSATREVKNRYRDEPTAIDSKQLPSRLVEIFKLFSDAEKASTAGVGGAARDGVQAAWTDKFVVPGVAGGPHAPRAFQVGRLQKDSIYYRLGVRNFDVVRSVNGEAFESPEKAMDLAQRLGNVGTLSIQVHRRGKPVNIDVNLD